MEKCFKMTFQTLVLFLLCHFLARFSTWGKT